MTLVTGEDPATRPQSPDEDDVAAEGEVADVEAGVGESVAVDVLVAVSEPVVAVGETVGSAETAGSAEVVAASVNADAAAVAAGDEAGAESISAPPPRAETTAAALTTRRRENFRMGFLAQDKVQTHRQSSAPPKGLPAMRSPFRVGTGFRVVGQVSDVSTRISTRGCRWNPGPRTNLGAMTTTEWLTDIALLLIVFRQLREGRVDLGFVLIPLGIVGFVAHSYLKSIPTAGNDLVLIGALIGVGAALGVAGGIYTRVRFDGRNALVRAGALSATLWVLGMGSRMAFQLWSQNGGAHSIQRFSVAHAITSEQAWVTAFVLMAVTEVVTRMATILGRSFIAARSYHLVPASRGAGSLLDLRA